MFERFTDRARRCVVLAQEEARMLNHNYIGTEHLLLGLISEGDGAAAHALKAVGIGLEDARAEVEYIIGRGQQAASGHIPLTPRLKEVFKLALQEAVLLGSNYVGTEHLLLGIVRVDESVAVQVMIRRGVDLHTVRTTVIALLQGYEMAPLNRAFRDLTQAAAQAQLGPALGRSSEVQDVVRILVGEPPGNPLLIGEAGVGVSTVVHGVAQAVTREPVASLFAGRCVLEVDLADWFRGARFAPADRGAPWQKVLEDTCRTPGTVLFIDHARTPVRLADRTVPVMDLLRPLLISGECQALASATPAQEREWASIDHELYRIFQPVVVAEMSEAASTEVLAEIRDRYEARHQVAITDAAITAAVTLAAEHITDGSLPGKAIALIDRAANHAARRAARRGVIAPGNLAEQVAAVRTAKDAAMDAQDYAAAASYREQEKALLARETAWKAEWKNTPAGRIESVTAEDVARALAEAN